MLIQSVSTPLILGWPVCLHTGSVSHSVVPGSVQIPEIRTRGKKSIRTGPGTARKSKSVLELEPEPQNDVCQF